MFDNINAEAFEKEINAFPEAIILDVRTAWEFESGHLENAVHLDFFSDTLEQDLQKLDPSKYYLIYCRSGARSYNACHLMSNMGFAKVTNLMGGIIAWHGKIV